MFCLIIAGVVVLLAIVFYLYNTWNNGYWEARGIPYVKPTFFVGNLGQTLSGKIHFQMIYSEIYKKFKDAPYVGYFKLRNPGIIVRDLDIVRDVLVKDFQKFTDNDFHIDSDSDPFMVDNPFVATGEDWKIKRAQWSSSMTSNRVKGMYDIMSEKADITVKHINDHIAQDPKEPMCVKTIAYKYLTDTIVGTVLGLKINSFEDPNNEFINTTSNLFVSDFITSLRSLCYFIAPWVNKIIGVGFVSKTVINRILAVTRQIVENRKTHGFAKNDFFEDMIKNKYSELQIAGRVFGFLSEGIETSSGLISFALYELAANPQVQSKLRQEIKESMDKNDGTLTYDALHSLPYLDQIVNEVLRIHPPVFAIMRVCTKAHQLPAIAPGEKPVDIPVGMTVIVPTYATGMDPDHFENPEVFNPDRFSPENKDPNKRFAFLPFSEGPRICVGQRLGLTNGKNCIAQIVRNFEIRVSPKTKTPLEIDPLVFVNHAVGGIWLTFHKINE